MKQRKKSVRVDWKTKEDMKLCYSISEVARMYGISEVTIRYWEREGAFTPRRSASGTRYYHREHLIIIDKLNYLIYQKGLTLKAAMGRLHGDTTGLEVKVIDRLQGIAEHLRTLSQKAAELLGE
ncbi:MerR family transcriptional regulator [Porphyromonas sp.]|uniref:MerR family transcriptional regulator n=1 Tax=Porphyromonas sp. TaxID=1924944 RepID=UPI0026DB6AA0|nr:MerR family transcriptional regulator [Porphyromonas sp.]MDO4771452.1 MerR family transcriptional regulator [Porphyromonas sp.]